MGPQFTNPTFSKLIINLGVGSGTELGIELTGPTVSDVPMTINKSHLSLSVLIKEW